MELNESVQRFKSQWSDAEKQSRRHAQNEEKLKQECEQLREQRAAGQARESKLTTDLTETQQKVKMQITLMSISFIVSNDEVSTVLRDALDRFPH